MEFPLQDPQSPKATIMSHVLVVPYPSRGHINPMMNLSKLLVSNNPNILVTFVVTQEWLTLIDSEPKPDNIRVESIPNVVGDKFMDVVEAVMTEMEAPFERLIDRLVRPPVTFIICDCFLFWAIRVGNRRNIPVAAFWTTSTSELWVQFFHIFLQRKNLENGEYYIDYIPSNSWVRLADIPLLDKNNHQILQWALKSCQWLLKAQYLLLPSIYELEPQVIDALKSKLTIPIYTIGPNIPYFNLGHNLNSLNATNNGAAQSYIDWLNLQPNGSVLYISYGSYLSVSRTQMDDIAAALHDSGVRFLWVTRDETHRLKHMCGKMGFVVPWCDQLTVLSHPSIGGYWTHCGWNSVIEGVFSGVPFLTFPLAMDQPLISKIIVEDWKIGWRVKKDDKLDTLVTKEEIVLLIRKFMDLDFDLGRDLRKGAKEFQLLCQLAIKEGGSSATNVKAFLKNIVESGLTHEASNGIHKVQAAIENFN
ncbi:putative hexosyltransferase [Medicago truncatula]|uniref:Putative hexosyltransferase n=1 Tax=Medicago truncatula TaxID=3880 RepID=G7J0P1_MEDTR|nr:UDP-glycosyltransferase 87A1 [Medicago truncatula]AES69559.1 UDP-glucosyltransferase family protein [Medicago truncatula]RHN67763.1 putative hexosyltransferase [Medicago truncatula]